MKTLSIRKWLIISLLAMFIIPVVFAGVSAALLGTIHAGSGWNQSWGTPIDQRQTQLLDKAAGLVAGNRARWSEPTWRMSTSRQLAGLGVGVVLRDTRAHVIYTGGNAVQPWNPTHEVLLMDGRRRLGTIDVSTADAGGGPPAPALFGLLGLVLTLIGVGVLMGRYVVRPLEATSLAARRIACGKLDFELPDSRVREVAEVRAAFDAMGVGLRESLGRQAQLEEERRFFISAIAHDLRTPLFSLRGYLDGLERGIASTPEKVTRYVAVCRQKADALERLVADLFAYSQVEYLEQTLHHGTVEFGSMLERSIDGLRAQAETKGVAISLVGSQDSGLLEGDKHLLERAMGNLLDNALRYTPAGGEIEVRWRSDSGRLTFTVADDGPGIATQDLPHLFDPLYRGEASRNRETGGGGLGLTIARRILRAHGGDLTAANRSSGGAELTGWLVCSPAAVAVAG